MNSINNEQNKNISILTIIRTIRKDIIPLNSMNYSSTKLQAPSRKPIEFHSLYCLQ